MSLLSDLRMILRTIVPKISSKNRFRLLLIFLLTLFASFAEVLTLGALVPFLSVVAAPDALDNYNFFYNSPFLTETSHHDMVRVLAIAFAFFAILSGALRVFLMRQQIMVAVDIGCDLSSEVFSAGLRKPYWHHLANNSSLIHAGSRKAYELMPNLILPSLTIFGAVLMIISICFGLFVIDVRLALFMILFLLHICMRWLDRKRFCSQKQ